MKTTIKNANLSLIIRNPINHSAIIQPTATGREFAPSPTKFTPRELLRSILKGSWIRFQSHRFQLDGLPKIHKPEPIPLRPIVSSIGSMTYNLAQHAAYILHPLVGCSSHHLNNTQSLIDKIWEIKLSPEEKITSYDVSALFTNIPPAEAITTIRQRLEKDETLAERTGLSIEEVVELMEVCLTTTYFSFKGKFYKQIHGCAMHMGSPISPIAANLCMEVFEERALGGYNGCGDENCRETYVGETKQALGSRMGQHKRPSTILTKFGTLLWSKRCGDLGQGRRLGQTCMASKKLFGRGTSLIRSRYFWAEALCKMACNNEIETRVYQAARDGSAQDLTDILERLNVDERTTALETKTKDGDDLATPYIIAARNGHLDSVKILLRYKANIEARGTLKVSIGDYTEITEGCTALWATAAYGHLNVMRLLIEQNAEVDCRTSAGSTPLRAAAFYGWLNIVDYLVENGADINARKNRDTTLPMATCYNGHMDVASYLVEHGADIHLQDTRGNTCLYYAAKGKHVEIAGKLLASGAMQNQNRQRFKLLLKACDDCNIEMVDCFINRPECTKKQRNDALELLGATIANDPDAYDIEKAFSFMKRGMEEMYEDPSCPLLKEEIKPVEAYENRAESQTLEELSLLSVDDHAIHMEGLIIRERILAADYTVLLYAVRYRGNELAAAEQYELCIGLWTREMEIGMNCDAPETEGLEFLTGCHVNAINTEGDTHLHLAVTFVPGPEKVESLKEMLELLLEIGSDTKVVNKNGQTAIDCCKTDEARRILSARRGLGAKNVDARKEAHKPWTSLLHCVRGAAAWRTALHVFQPAAFPPFSTIRRHVVFGGPFFLLPSGVQPRAAAQSSFLSFLIMCPIQFHLRLKTRFI
ncbi:Protein fem-1-like B [Stylophora pistillata]|uniref:Protein fem-1-like B n=1 Tax=Stylophora pistillata TaxID=50429 RepID=A0A2B4RVM2_STYPI|nr:Protein fem-1-like B [Stylophora pistillata]